MAGGIKGDIIRIGAILYYYTICYGGDMDYSSRLKQLIGLEFFLVITLPRKNPSLFSE
jgi:hypothetical protein